MKIKVGDKIKMISGNDRGRMGKVSQVLPRKNQVVVKKMNMKVKHVKSEQGQKGGIIKFEAPINVSKVMLICPECGKPTRVGYQLDKNKKKYRICRKCKSLLDKQTDKQKKK